MFGKLGSKTSQALSTEFFQWFHLEETGSVREGELTHRAYQPTSSQFHDLVQVILTSDHAESLKAVRLSVRRSFIDDPQHFTMAADISKSFLGAALNPDDMAIMSHAMAQIRQYQPSASQMAVRRVGGAAGENANASADQVFEAMEKSIDAGQPVYVTMRSFKREGETMVPANQRRPAPPLPGEGEPAYLAYTGKRRQLELKLNHGLLRMVNASASGVEQLVISVSQL